MIFMRFLSIIQAKLRVLFWMRRKSKHLSIFLQDRKHSYFHVVSKQYAYWEEETKAYLILIYASSMLRIKDGFKTITFKLSFYKELELVVSKEDSNFLSLVEG